MGVYIYTRQKGKTWNDAPFWEIIPRKKFQNFKIKIKKLLLKSEIHLFYLLFGCLVANFGPCLRGQLHWSNVNHCFLISFQCEGQQESHNRCLFVSPHAAPYIDSRSLSISPFWNISNPLLNIKHPSSKMPLLSKSYLFNDTFIFSFNLKMKKN